MLARFQRIGNRRTGHGLLEDCGNLCIQTRFGTLILDVLPAFHTQVDSEKDDGQCRGVTPRRERYVERVLDGVLALQQIHRRRLRSVGGEQRQRTAWHQTQLQTGHELAQALEQVALALVIVFADIDRHMFARVVTGRERELQRLDQRLNFQHGTGCLRAAHINFRIIDQQGHAIGRHR